MSQYAVICSTWLMRIVFSSDVSILDFESNVTRETKDHRCAKEGKLMSRRSARNILCFIGLAIAMFMGTLDSTIVNIALPKIMSAFHSSLNNTSWVTTIYVLALSVFMVTCSKIADRFGRKKVMLIGLVLFGGFSLACMMAPSMGYLIGFRFMQGIGGAIISPLALPMGIEAFGKKHISLLSAAVGAITALAAASGPFIGGIVLQVSTWRWIFGINVPLAVLAILLISFFTNESYDNSLSDKTDPLGTLLLIAGLGGISFGLLQGRQLGWHSALIILSLSMGVLALVGFVFLERKVASPVIELSLFRNKPFAASTAVYFVTGFGVVCPTLIFNYFLQNVLHDSPLQAAMLIVPVSLTVIVAMPLGTRMMDAVGAIPVNFAGLAITSMSLFAFAAIDTQTSTAFMVMLMILNGFGFGFSTISIVSALNHLPKEKSGIGSGIVNAARQIGTCLGIAVLVTVLDGYVDQAKNQILDDSQAIVTRSQLSPSVKTAISTTMHRNLTGNNEQQTDTQTIKSITTAAKSANKVPSPSRTSDYYQLYQSTHQLGAAQRKTAIGNTKLITLLKTSVKGNPVLEKGLTPVIAGMVSIDHANTTFTSDHVKLETGIKLLAQERELKDAMTTIKQQKNKKLSSAFGKTYLVAGVITLLSVPLALLTDTHRNKQRSRTVTEASRQEDR